MTQKNLSYKEAVNYYVRVLSQIKQSYCEEFSREESNIRTQLKNHEVKMCEFRGDFTNLADWDKVEIMLGAFMGISKSDDILITPTIHINDDGSHVVNIYVMKGETSRLVDGSRLSDLSPKPNSISIMYDAANRIAALLIELRKVDKLICKISFSEYRFDGKLFDKKTPQSEVTFEIVYDIIEAEKEMLKTIFEGVKALNG